ncbi:glycosyltransferase family 2 protein [Actinomyces slackii]|uniref:Poly-beta-1,6-N-acetyl-D-glucosamine synthase n=2 Tax=Actinomyces slackii TaxID=52774 RepID=A0A3S4U3C6_9ACTO|nr:glycosyltransferase family 2 protein [Actinomyces slackii]VEG75513.1 Poly-beta-1,6-N-acetyl-D-glucosamine synthase [Actinomyces slackii]
MTPLGAVGAAGRTQDLLEVLPTALDRIGWWGALAMIALSLLYALTLLIASRSEPRRSAPAVTPPLHIVILMPCLNEAEVIGASVARLSAITDPNLRILVIDDGSDDETAQQALIGGDPRVEVMRRVAPRARLGKGEALNDALDLIRRRYAAMPARQVIVGVMDADGRLDPHAIADAHRAFASQEVGAVQMGVRINNRFGSLLARMQDMEFVVFTEVFQRGRRRLGSVGMGGNAQFVRLAALNALGPRPWTRSLTEDFDLGVRLNTTRWINEFWSGASVHQQGVTSLSRLLRQRTRWFQGNLQSAGLLWRVTRQRQGWGRADTLWQILTPYMLLAGSLLSLSFLITMIMVVVAAIMGWPQPWAWMVVAYTIAFGPGLIYGFLYWRIERHEGLGPLRALAYAHLFVLYGLLPSLYGWRALGRALVGRTGWAKTAREAEPATQAPTGQAGGPGGPSPLMADEAQEAA